jgi:hypothetical protein
VFCTGNNLTPASDLARRSLVVRLDASMDTAMLRARSFQLADLRAHVAEHRGRLLVAALTTLSAHRVAGYPARGAALPSFERWSRFAREPLVWLGMADPVATQLSETDDESAQRGVAFELIAARVALMEQTTFVAADIADWADSIGGGHELAEALSTSGCLTPSDPQKVGYWLRNNRDRVANGWKLEQGSTVAGKRTWHLRRSPYERGDTARPG